MDTKGNIALQGTYAGGPTISATPAASVGIFGMTTNASNIDKLNGKGMQMGGSASLGMILGGEVNVIPDQENECYYYGGTGFVGISTPSTPEAHAEWGETGTITQMNIFDAMREIYIQIMEW